MKKFVKPEFQRSIDKICTRLQVTGGKYGGVLHQNINNQMLIDGCHTLGYHIRAAPNNMVKSKIANAVPQNVVV